MTTDPYRTVLGRGEARVSVRGSEFIGHAMPASTVEDAEAFIDAVSDEYADATHNVPAYRIRADPLREWASDDGEPTNSAGKPALSVLKHEELENVVVVITRYYGGTNLGVGGLVRAYSQATKKAVEAAGIKEERPHEQVSITIEYDDSGTVRGIIESTGYEFDAAYEADVSFSVRTPVSEAATLRDRIQSATSGRAKIE
ncbi:IMPACT family protein [Haladaptatus sp. ZSTT2]|uniref:IMPACT family protein n=1 Tax=Haladaptatus sp. ZSTT2 TaxID=3120515 RepID=UPI00300F6805